MLLQLHLHSRRITWLQWIGQWQPHDETRNILVLRFGASCFRGLMVQKSEMCLVACLMSFQFLHGCYNNKIPPSDFVWLTEYIRSVVPEAGIKGRNKQLHPTDTMGCNYLSLPLISASDTTFLIPSYKYKAYCNLWEYKPRSVWMTIISQLTLSSLLIFGAINTLVNLWLVMHTHCLFSNIGTPKGDSQSKDISVQSRILLTFPALGSWLFVLYHNHSRNVALEGWNKL